MAEREQELRRQFAAIEHQRWTDWQRWMHDQCAPLESGELVIPAALVERWERQIATPFDQLSEPEQRSDLEQVERYWPLVLGLLGENQRLREELRLSTVENVALHDAAKKVVADPILAGRKSVEALVVVLAGQLGTRDLDAEQERDQAQADLAAARAEVERLRGALESLSQCMRPIPGGTGGPAGGFRCGVCVGCHVWAALARADGDGR